MLYPGINGELAYTRKPKGNGYLITTNFNHARRRKLHGRLWIMSTHFYLMEKYETADNMLSKFIDQDDLTVENMASVLDATHRDSLFDTRFSIKTLFSTAFDLKNMQISLYYKRQFDKPIVLDIKQELDKIDTYKKVSLEEVWCQK